ncbi:hypothetical protein GH714_042227 [Hevea brasiliensis]|uniref:Peroxisomal adenine nucleotide carrier 1 n=1 Tax=Hevea brasiliensis TaxID=3981 RepID=A0A6A6MX12_HEVBR|nr:hypothetical protein GH714_042227 [Hevea brasiliensis]
MGVDLESLSEATSGAIGSLLSTTILYPLDTSLRYGLLKDADKCLWQSKGLWQTLTEGTWSDAFDGLGISLLLTSNPSIQYTVFDQLKQRLLKGKEDAADKGSSVEALSAFAAFVLGAISKSAATFITYPAIRCKVMIQAADSDDDENKKGQPKSSKTVPAVVCEIWRREGFLGFFKGLQAQILKTVLSSALLLMIKEKITRSTWVLILAIRRGRFLDNHWILTGI